MGYAIYISRTVGMLRRPKFGTGRLLCSKSGLEKAMKFALWDPDFNSADLPMMMRIADLPSRYRKHFLGA